MGQTAFMLMFVTVLSKVFGFVREAVMSFYYGTGDVAAVYIAANTLPVVIANFVANGIIFGYIPLYNKVEKEEGSDAAKDFTSNLFNILLVIASIAVVFGIVFARAFCKIFAPSLTGDTLDMAVVFTRIIMFAVYAYFYSSVFRGYLNLKGNFIIPATTGIIMNVIIICFMAASGILNNPYLLAIGCLLGNVLQYILFPKAIREKGYKHKRKFDIHNKYIKMLFKISLPVIVSAAAGEIALTVDNSMANFFFGNSAMTVLKYSKSLLALITGIVTVSVTTSIFPKISKLGQLGKIEKMKTNISSAMVLTLLLVVPATFGMMALSKEVVSIVYLRGKFNAEDVVNTAKVLFAYAPFIIFQSFSDVIDKGFYSVGDSKTPVIVVVIQQIANIILNFILINFFGLEGLAIATSLATLIGAGLMLFRFRQNFGSMKLKTSAISMTKIVGISLVMGIMAKSLNGFLMGKNLSLLLSFLITVIVAVLFYAIAILLARIPEVMKMVNQLYHKFLKKAK